MRFAALRAPWYKGYLVGGTLNMAGDHVEHAITYFVLWQQFHSVALAAFAVVAHWLPPLLLSIPAGALAERADCRRIVQAAAGLFMLVSLLWGVLFATGTLQPWMAVILLLLHGLAGALWTPAEQLMLYDMVGPEVLPSAVRLQATGLNMGMLAGPAIGSALLFTVGPVVGMFVNIAIYLPFVIYLFITPFDGHRRGERRPRMHFSDLPATLRDVPKYPTILVALILQGAVALLIGNALVPLLPDFGAGLGLTDSGLAYGMLLVAMSTGAVLGGIGLEAIGRIRASTRLAIGAALVFAVGILVFALSSAFWLCLVALVVAGVGRLVSASTSQAIVQLAAPPDRRGRFVGAFAMTSNGLQVVSGLLIGGLASAIGVAGAIGLDAAVLVVATLALLVVVRAWMRRHGPREASPAPVALADGTLEP